MTRDQLNAIFPFVFVSEERMDENGESYRVQTRGVPMGTHYRRMSPQEEAIVEMIIHK